MNVGLIERDVYAEMLALCEYVGHLLYATMGAWKTTGPIPARECRPERWRIMKKADNLTEDIKDVKSIGSQSARSSRIAGRPSKSRAVLGFQKVQSDLRRLEQQVAELQAESDAKHRLYQEPQSLTELKPRREPEAGKTAMEMIAGQWPGDEEPEDLLKQLKEMG